MPETTDLLPVSDPIYARLEEQIDKVRVVARATAEHKLRIVMALKARGFICAMTGSASTVPTASTALR